MAYADQKMSGGRIAAIVIVALIHAIIGYAFVTGLAYQYVKKAAEKLNTFDVNEPPPPPPEEPPPPPPEQQQPPPVVTPPPIVSVPSPAPPTIVTVPTPPPVYVPAPPAPPAPPPPPPAAPTVNKSAGPKGNPANWITNDDYPASALRAEAQGTTTIAWDITTDGRIENCHTTASSGNADLDDAACRALSRRARYTPALDQSGAPIRVTGQTRRVVWRLPAD